MWFSGPSVAQAGLVSWNTTAAGSAAGLGACLYLYGFHVNFGCNWANWGCDLQFRAIFRFGGKLMLGFPVTCDVILIYSDSVQRQNRGIWT